MAIWILVIAAFFLAFLDASRASALAARVEQEQVFDLCLLRFHTFHPIQDFQNLSLAVVELALPDGVIDFDPEHSVFHPYGASVLSNDRAYCFFPAPQSLSLAQALGKGGILRAQHAQDISVSLPKDMGSS